jgi:hypothetical protein
MNVQKLFTILGLGASFVALAYPDVPTNHAAHVAISAPPAATIGSGDLSHATDSDYAPHAFRDSVDSPDVCDICRESKGHKNHIGDFASPHKFQGGEGPLCKFCGHPKDDKSHQSALAVVFQSPQSTELDSLRADNAELRDTIRQLQEQISRLTITQPQPAQEPKRVTVAQAAPVANNQRSFSVCSGRAGIFNGRFRGR